MIKGDLSGRQVVKQLGFVEETLKKRTIIEDPDQPLLRPGTEALLTLGSAMTERTRSWPAPSRS